MTDTILVTGASRGIGRATALRLAHDGFDIALHYRSRKQDAERVAEEIRALGREARLLCFDVAERDQARTLLEADIEAHGSYFGVVCNAGITADNPFPALTGDDWDSVVHTNLDGFYNVLHPLVMPMIRRRKPGRIVTIASMSGLIGNRGQVNYSAAKAGIIGATKALAIELAKRHITVNCVAPGWIDTDMTHHLSQEEVLKLIPMRRTGQAEDVAGVVSLKLFVATGFTHSH